MAAKVTREAREKALKTVMRSAMLAGGVDGVVTRIVDVLDDLNEAITFFAQWKRGTLLALEPGQKLDRWETIVRLNQRMDRDPELYVEMLRYPRYLAAFATQEAMGLPIVGFLGQVKEVRFVEEEPGLHWLLVPACHRGCEALEGQDAARSNGSCTACGRPQGEASSSANPSNSLATALDRIHAVDDYLVRSLEMDRSVRDRVMKDPTEAFTRASRTLFGAAPEELFGIHQVRLAVDTDTMLYCIRLADHETKRTAAMAGAGALSHPRGDREQIG
jgi:hypothetical protein